MQLNTTEIANLCGHAGGVALFLWFLVLTARRPISRISASKLPFWIGITTIVWNAASIGVILANHEPGILSRCLAAIAFAALSALPALLFRLCAGRRFPVLARLGYLMAALAAGLHVVEGFTGGEDLHGFGLAIITVGFGSLTALSAGMLVWSPDKRDPALISRTVGTMSLFLFTISFAHFAGGHLDNAWSKEMVFHHAGIPLALIILLQDHRFVLLDALIRVSAHVALAFLFGWATLLLLAAAGRATQIVGGAMAFALFGAMRTRFETLLFRMLFRPPDEESIAKVYGRLKDAQSTESQYLETAGKEAAGLLGARFLGVNSVAELGVAALPSSPSYVTLPPVQTRQRQTALAVPVRIAAGEYRYLLLGDRGGGRPYLSSDLELLARLADVVSEQLQQVRDWEARRLAASAELRALQAQINPHFLFNALNALYGAIPREASAARKTALNLADLFRYFVRSDRVFSSIGEELSIVEAYLSIEKQRLSERLTYSVTVEPELSGAQIPILTIQPLVENAIKHGVAPHAAGGMVEVRVQRDGEQIDIRVQHQNPDGMGNAENSRPGDSGLGVALVNIRRRLELCYGPAAELNLSIEPNHSAAHLKIPLQGPRHAAPRNLNEPIAAQTGD